ncbi:MULTISPECIES: ATP-binding protein [unclassified Mucilaginibacter]|uniref:ATP-binding protein n=1 Tax=unclassified Mucilaginibacter TaxID=2617802 RepID=UPI00339B9654
MPTKIIRTVFEPFSRDTSNGMKEGLGLGLFIASKIAKAHGGKSKVTSDTEKTTFSFILPNS